MSEDPRIALPKDANAVPIQRAMGQPIASAEGFSLGSNVSFVDIFNLENQSFFARAFTGLSIQNPSASNHIILSIGQPFSTYRHVVCPPQQFFVLDNLTFGPGIIDDTTGEKATRVRAKLQDVQEGTFATATINYSGSGQPSDQMTVEVNGLIYEFSDDLSKEPGSSVRVPIGVDADATWTNFVAAIIANEQALTPSIDTGADIVTLTSNYGGAYGDGLVIQDGATPTGATFSGNTAGGTGGAVPIFHIW